jgi:hypothetical protein
MSAGEVFLRITEAFENAGIAYMLAGSFASTAYSSPRSTQDIDFVISATPAQLKSFVESLGRTAAVLRVQREALDQAYLEAWISELEPAEQWSAAKRATGLE